LRAQLFLGSSLPITRFVGIISIAIVVAQLKTQLFRVAFPPSGIPLRFSSCMLQRIQLARQDASPMGRFQGGWIEG